MSAEQRAKECGDRLARALTGLMAAVEALEESAGIQMKNLEEARKEARAAEAAFREALLNAETVTSVPVGDTCVKVSYQTRRADNLDGLLAQLRSMDTARVQKFFDRGILILAVAPDALSRMTRDERADFAEFFGTRRVPNLSMPAAIKPWLAE